MTESLLTKSAIKEKAADMAESLNHVAADQTPKEMVAATKDGPARQHGGMDKLAYEDTPPLTSGPLSDLKPTSSDEFKDEERPKSGLKLLVDLSADNQPSSSPSNATQVNCTSAKSTKSDGINDKTFRGEPESEPPDGMSVAVDGPTIDSSIKSSSSSGHFASGEIIKKVTSKFAIAVSFITAKQSSDQDGGIYLPSGHYFAIPCYSSNMVHHTLPEGENLPSRGRSTSPLGERVQVLICILLTPPPMPLIIRS